MKGSSKASQLNGSTSSTTTTTLVMPQEQKDLSTMQKIAGLVVMSLLGGGIGALTAWAFTSIPPLGGALLIATVVCGGAISGEIGQSLVQDSEMSVAFGDKKIGLNSVITKGVDVIGFITTIAAVNAIAILLFPYLGMTALSATQTTVFAIGNTVLIVGLLMLISQDKNGK